MTEKQENIIAVALRLFADQGYESTPTSQIAKEAGVSEGLIFRHFENKEGLLKALVDEGQNRIMKFVELIIQENNPKKRISKTIDLAAKLIEKEREFWALQFTIKYKNQHFASLKKQSDAMTQLFMAVYHAFAELNYEEPQKEAEMLALLLEGLSSFLILQPEDYDIQPTLDFIKSKYQI